MKLQRISINICFEITCILKWRQYWPNGHDLVIVKQYLQDSVKVRGTDVSPNG